MLDPTKELVGVQQGLVKQSAPINRQSGTGNLHKEVQVVVEQPQLVGEYFRDQNDVEGNGSLLQLLLYSLYYSRTSLSPQNPLNDSHSRLTIRIHLLDLLLPALHHFFKGVFFLDELLFIGMVLEVLVFRVRDHRSFHVELAICHEDDCILVLA